MAEKYTYTDVIIDPNDPRVEIGKEYWFSAYPAQCISNAGDNIPAHTLKDVVVGSSYPFVTQDDLRYSCLIRKKEPEKKYVPFDLTKEEDRNFLKGRWIKTDGDEEKITGFERDDDGVWHIKISADYLLPEDMLNLWRFEDNTLCGKLAEETE